MGQTKQVLGEIITNNKKTSDIIGEIAASMNEQSTSVEER